MQPQLAYRVGRTLTGLATLTALALGACKSDNATGPGTTTPTGVYKGAIVGKTVSGVLTITFPAAAATLAAGSVRFSAMGTEAAVTIGGKLRLQGTTTDIILTGTYDPSATAPTPQLTLSGGPPNYVITGNYVGTLFFGTFTGPSGGGQWTVAPPTPNGGVAATVFCGAYSGSSTGYWNLILSGTSLTGLAETSDSALKLNGTYTSGANPNATISIGSPSIGTAHGNLDPVGGTGSGTWAVPANNGAGDWTTSATCL